MSNKISSYIPLDISLSTASRRRFRRGLQNVLIGIYDLFNTEAWDE